ncbi:hypothetical protein [Alicyclobacillus fastidiosus]|uniref:Uncharacterized protein n=1 Tax=Alicyclobacillus fastidiosus TaxID=392011 RepID=A0ABV5A9W9_9BACL|nr:hypothetical protein [Alicyclobacillus fastidiosus]WEH07772.1 hypothetical protein PYS47_13445 [Alicyclobacillus fastidiosus]
MTSKTATNTTGVTSPPPTNAVQFSAYIARAMDQVKQTTKGPVLFAPTAPTFHPSVQFIGVQESASEDEYTVRLFSSSSSVPLNDPTLNHLSASSLLGMFSGRYYPSHNTAMNELNEQFDVKKVGAPVDTNGVMKEYSTGQSYSTGTLANSDYPQHVMEWQEGKWTIDVFGAPSLDFLHDAEQVDSFLQSHALPPTDGRVLINPDVTGTPIAQIGWVFGNTLYQCEAPLTSSTRWNALQMAVSMREYDNYKVEP